MFNRVELVRDYDNYGCFVRGCAEICGHGDVCCGSVVERAGVTTLAGMGTPSFSDGSGSNAGFHFPIGVAVDASGNMFVADRVNNRIRKVTAGGGTRIGPATLHARVADSHVGALA